MKLYYLFVLIFGLNLSCTQISSKSITKVSQNELNNVILIDVRTPEEYRAGHIDEAININWFDADFSKQLKPIDKNKTIYVYCKKGGRSAKAQKMLDSLGYKSVVNLEGGYDAWLATKK